MHLFNLLYSTLLGSFSRRIWPHVWHSTADSDVGVPLQAGETASNTNISTGMSNLGRASGVSLGWFLNWCCHIAECTIRSCCYLVNWICCTFKTTSRSQTASWLRPAPSMLKECAQSVTQPQPLKTLLHHHRCHGHLFANGRHFCWSFSISVFIQWQIRCITFESWLHNTC